MGNILSDLEADVRLTWFQAILDSSATSILVIDQDHTVIYINNAALKGLRKIKDTIELSLGDDFEADTITGSHSSIFKAVPQLQPEFLTRSKTVPFHNVVQIKDQYIKLSITPCFDVFGDPIGPSVAWTLVTHERLWQETINQTIQSMKDCSEKLAQSVDSLYSVSKETLQKANHVSSVSQQSSQISRQSAEQAQSMNVQLLEVSQSMENVNTAASRIAKATDASNQSISLLQDRSKLIGGTVTKIIAIARQTNLLSLNASIEAEWAGEHGKGFGVVASEVKELAQQTGHASREISTAIDEMTTGVGNSALELAQIAQSIEGLETIAAQVAHSTLEQQAPMSRMVENLHNINCSISNLSSEAEDLVQQASNTNKIAQALGELGEQLRESAHELDTLVRVSSEASTYF